MTYIEFSDFLEAPTLGTTKINWTNRYTQMMKILNKNLAEYMKNLKKKQIKDSIEYFLVTRFFCKNIEEQCKQQIFLNI